MKELQKRQRIRRIIYSIPSLILLMVLTFLLARGAIRIVGKERFSIERTRELEAQAALVVLREQELKENIKNLGTEEGIKSEIRRRFNVIQEGEHVAVIVDERKSATSTDASKKPWYKKLWSVIISGK